MHLYLPKVISVVGIREVRSKNPQLIYEQHPSSKEENITIIVILPLQAADLKNLLEGRVST